MRDFRTLYQEGQGSMHQYTFTYLFRKRVFFSRLKLFCHGHTCVVADEPWSCAQYKNARSTFNKIQLTALFPVLFAIRFLLQKEFHFLTI